MFDFNFPKLESQTDNTLKVGDRVVVGNRPEISKVEKIAYDKATNRTEIFLDWGPFGKSKVYAHDEKKTWCKIDSFN